jgi:peptide-methionine (S)-S-oxide reductase
MGMKTVALAGLVAVGGLLGLTAPHKTNAPVPVEPVSRAGLVTATFAGGCFWSVEKLFQEMPGVVYATSGFMGGKVKDPSYDQVITGATGHLESVEVVFDSSKVTYRQLLDAYWHNIDPVTPNGQFCDFGPQYHTAIFYHDAAQRRLAEESKKALDASRRFSRPVAVEIREAGEFYPAEEYHQDFYKKNPIHYNSYRIGCGRDRQLKAIWGEPVNASTH